MNFMMTGEWVIVVAQKSFDIAKSRLRLAKRARASVARAMFQDTVLAARNARQVRIVIVVVDRAGDAQVVCAPEVRPVVAGSDLDPRFGPASSRAHRRSGAHENEAWDLGSLRHDVDDLDDLDDLFATGAPGPHLRAVLEVLAPATTREIA